MKMILDNSQLVHEIKFCMFPQALVVIDIEKGIEFYMDTVLGKAPIMRGDPAITTP